MRNATITIIFLLGILSTINSYKILGLFPHPGLSHFHVFHPLMKGLSESGHSVTVISHFPNKIPIANYEDLPLTGLDTLSNSVDLNNFSRRFSFNHFIEFFLLHHWGKESCENAFNSTAMAKVLQMKEKYDLIIMEQFNADCMVGVAHKLQTPFIALSSCALMPWHYDRIGNPQMPSFIPALFMGYSDNMSLMERIGNWLSVHGLKFLYRQFSDRAGNQLIKQYLGDGIPDISELTMKTSLIMVNQHYSLSGVKPLSPQIIEVGGIHIGEPKQIDSDLQKLLDTADNGVIYISWGSMIRSESMALEKREALLQALGQLKQRIIWKWENETLTNQPSNVFVRKWLPQREILCHPKVRAFMNHGGLLGCSETAYCGVPVVSTPMYGDQFLNSAALASRGMGVVLHYEDFTKENILGALNKVLEPSYMENAKKVSYAFKNRERKPLETAIWHVENVIKTGGATLLKSHSIHLPWYVYHSLDVITIIFGVILLSFISWIYVLKKIFKNKNTNVIIKNKLQ